MKLNYRVVVSISLVLLLVSFYLNWKYEVIAFHPFRSEGIVELRVMTWNIHCSKGADSVRQRRIAELILKEDADFVQLNEFYLDSCSVIDILLRARYPYIEECHSHMISGDVFYSKWMMSNSGRVKTPKEIMRIQTIKTTITAGYDSVQVYGVHLASNRYKGSTIENEFESDTTSYDRYKDAQKRRCYQAHWTKMAVLEVKHPVIVMGDMNDFNCSAPLDTFASCGLIDAWWEGGNGYGHTFHKGWLKLRIDHILYSKELKLESIKVIESNLSDHNPVVAGFSLKKN